MNEIENKETLILVNPKSGSQGSDGTFKKNWPSFQTELLSVLGSARVQVAVTTAQDHGEKTVRAFLKNGGRHVVVVGGDGTASEAMQGFYEELTNEKSEFSKRISNDARLSIVPLGRGNDFFKTLLNQVGYSIPFLARQGSSYFWKKGIQALEKNSTRKLDIIQAEWISVSESTPKSAPGRYVLNIAGAGFPGRVVERVHQKIGTGGIPFFSRSSMVYLVQSISTLFEYRPEVVEVRLDGRQIWNDKAFWVQVLNGKFNAGGACWSDRADPFDGRLDVSVMKGRSIPSFLKASANAISGDWSSDSKTTLYSGNCLEIRRQAVGKDSPSFLETDGDLKAPPGLLGVRFTLLSQQFSLTVPVHENH